MLRTILLILGIVIILAIAWDGWRRKRRQHNIAKSKMVEPQLDLDIEPQVEEPVENVPKALPEEYTEYSTAEEQLENDNVVSTNFTVEPEQDGHLTIETVENKASANDALPEQDETPQSEKIYSANEVLPKLKVRDNKAKVEKTIQPEKEIVALTVMPLNSRPFAGYDLVSCLQENSLHFGEFSIFHRHKYKNGKGPLYFSVASLVKPGTINPKELGTLQAPGLAIFMELNDPKHDRIVFKQMLATSHQIAKVLNGVVCDDKRVPLREASIKAYANKINL